MQERYLGDIHDFFKFLFLKNLSRALGCKIGLNWYLVNPEDLGQNEIKKNDGERRYFLDKEIYNQYDKKLIEELSIYKNLEKRNIKQFCNSTHLKDHIKFYKIHIKQSFRETWLKDSLKYFKDEKIIFLDPDNGVSWNFKGKKSIKYVTPADIKVMTEDNKVIIFTQFQSFTKTTTNHIKNILDELRKFNFKFLLPVVRNRTAPNTFFITIGNKELSTQISSFYKSYQKKYKEVELITL